VNYRSGADGRCNILALQMLRFHSLGGSTGLYCVKEHHGRHLDIITTISEIRLHQSKRIYFRNKPNKFHSDGIWNDEAL